LFFICGCGWLCDLRIAKRRRRRRRQSTASLIIKVLLLLFRWLSKSTLYRLVSSNVYIYVNSLARRPALPEFGIRTRLQVMCYIAQKHWRHKNKIMNSLTHSDTKLQNRKSPKYFCYVPILWFFLFLSYQYLNSP